MKRLFSILAVISLVVAMAVPVFAATDSYTPVTYREVLGDITERTVEIDWSYLKDGELVYGKAIQLIDADNVLRLEFCPDPGGVYTFWALYYKETGVLIQGNGNLSLVETVELDSTDADYPFVIENWLTLRPVAEDSVSSSPLVEVITYLHDRDLFFYVLIEVLQMIPICLSCWVCYKGLRKALDLLQQILYKA